jgi:hypothetical protein
MVSLKCASAPLGLNNPPLKMLPISCWMEWYCACIPATVRRIWQWSTRDIAVDLLDLEQVVIIYHSMILWPEEYD